MNIIPLFAFALALAPNPPVPLSEIQMQDIRCVAVIGIAASEQRTKNGVFAEYPALSDDGKRWAGIVGDRVMEATGQPREVVALAIQTSVKTEQEMSATAEEGNTGFRERLTACVGKMNASLGALEMADGEPEAEPVK
jgi:hypothetical protein